jgi:hypothetical protein
MLGIPRDEKVYTHLIEYTKEFEKKNPQFPKNIASYLDSTAWPMTPEGQNIFLYNQENPENPYAPLVHLKAPSRCFTHSDGSDSEMGFEECFVLFAKHWTSQEASFTARNDGLVPLNLEIPNNILPLFDLLILEHLLLELSELKGNQKTPFDYILNDKEEFDGDGWGFCISSHVSKALTFECHRQNEGFSPWSNRFGSLFNYAYIRLLQELGDHLVSIFTSWVYSVRGCLPAEFKRALWARLTSSLERSLAHQIERRCWI